MSQKVGAVILAAGFSSRMADFKPLLPLDGTSLLGFVARTLRRSGLTDILAVAGHRAGEVQAEAARLSLYCAFNPDFSQGMFSSVLVGMNALPQGLDAVLVLPVDIPLVRPRTIRELCGRAGQCPVCYPTFQGKRGHPPLIDAGLLPDIAAWPGDNGLAGALRAVEQRLGAQEAAVADENILFDLDTPEDYRQARLRLEAPSGCITKICAGSGLESGYNSGLILRGDSHD